MGEHTTTRGEAMSEYRTQLRERVEALGAAALALRDVLDAGTAGQDVAGEGLGDRDTEERDAERSSAPAPAPAPSSPRVVTREEFERALLASRGLFGPASSALRAALRTLGLTVEEGQ